MAELKWSAEELNAMQEAVQEAYGISILGSTERAHKFISHLTLLILNQRHPADLPEEEE